MKKSIRMLLLGLIFMAPLAAQQLLPGAAKTSAPWHAKVGPLLKMQLDVKDELRQNLQKTTTRRFEQMGISADMERQKVYLFFKEYPSAAQINVIEQQGGTVYRDSWIPPVGAHPYGYILALLPLDALNSIAGLEAIAKIETAEKNFYPKNDLATVAVHAKDAWQAGYTGSNVTVGVLDSGLDSAFADFPTLTAGIDYSAWPGTDTGIANTVTGHGTHVTGSVLGRGTLSSGTYRGSAPGANLVFIKIGSDATGGASTDAINYAMRDAVDVYGVDIITMSYGGWGTWHDGSSTEDQAVDYAVGQGATVFISAGNESSDELHYSGTVAANSTTGDIQVNVTGAGTNNTAIVYNMVWYDGPGTNNELKVNFFNNAHMPLASFEAYAQSESIRGTESLLTGYSTYSLSGNRTFYLQVVNNSSNSQDFHLYYYSGYNQSGAGSVTFNAPDPDYTIGSPATADSAIAVGAWVSRKYWTNYLDNTYSYVSGEIVDDIASFSSRGPRVDGMLKPNIAAPGSAIISAKDPLSTTTELTIDNDGINDGSGPANYYVMQGTSMATPIAAGTAALLLQQDPSLTPKQLRNLLYNTTDEDSYTGSLPNSTWGYGKLNIEKAIEQNLPGSIAAQTVNSSGSYSFSGTDVSIDFSVSGSDGYVSVTQVNNSPAGGTDNVTGGLHHVSAIRYWQIESDKSGYTAAITFSYDPLADGIVDENTLRIAHRENPADPWTEYGDISIDTGLDQITANNVTAFSQWIFAAADGDNPLPVSLNSFSGKAQDNSIRINWTTASELQNSGFNLYRAEKKEHPAAETVYKKINSELLPGAGNTSEAHDYSFTDSDVQFNTTYLYRLEDISYSGEVHESESIEVLFDTPLKFALQQNYPNPFNPGTVISYTVGAVRTRHAVSQQTSSQQVNLSIYNILGQRVATLVDKKQVPGRYQVAFDASALSGGIYIYKLTAQGDGNTFIQSKKMLLLK